MKKETNKRVLLIDKCEYWGMTNDGIHWYEIYPSVPGSPNPDHDWVSVGETIKPLDPGLIVVRGYPKDDHPYNTALWGCFELVDDQ